MNMALQDTAVNTIDKIRDLGMEIVPEQYRVYVTLGVFIVLISVYAIFVWKFYRFLAKRDLLELNLKQYNNVEHSLLNKMLALGLFIVEYIIILPIVVYLHSDN